MLIYIDFAVCKIVWWILGECSEPGFPHDFAKKNDRRDLKMGCIDASRRSYNLCSKLGSKLIFFDEIMAILVLPDHFWILTAFS
jgi:hypothetical protein